METLPKIKLSKRLEKIARLIPLSGGVVDIGTDHGHLPVWLAQNGHSGKLTATDIKKGPLSVARKTAARFGQARRLDFVLCDGLSGIDASDFGTIVIAGMGGETIAHILSEAPWTRDSSRPLMLILQPMTKSQLLRLWLFENGYEVLSESLVEDGRIFEIICATGARGFPLPYSPAELLTGHKVLIENDPLFPKRLCALILKTQKAILGLSASLRADFMRLNELNTVLKGLIEMQNEIGLFESPDCKKEEIMPTVKEISKFFTEAIPPEIKWETDNVGLLVGINDAVVSRAVVALDISDNVIDDAIAAGAQLIIAHHPIIREIKRVCDDDLTGRRIIKMLRNGISGICLHTNLDFIKGGVNDCLAEKLGVSIDGWLQGPKHTASGVEYGMGRYGQLEKPMELAAYLDFIKESLGVSGIRYTSAGRPVFKVGLCGGSGDTTFDWAVKKGCDTLVTSDIKYHTFLSAKEFGINLIDADHFCTENVVSPFIADMLRRNFPDVEVIISKSHTQAVKFFL